MLAVTSPFCTLLLASVAATLTPPTSAAAHSGEGQQPNVVILLADDLGYGDLSSYGAALIETPRLDALAAGGARLTSFYVRPRCSPTRAALLTGLTPQRVGIFSALSQWSEYGLSSSETTFAELMQGAGYRTGYFGKWHLGDSPSQLPGGQGFSHYLTTPWGHLARPNAYVDSEATEWEWNPDARMSTARFTERTLEFIAEAEGDETPFLAILSYSTPHLPAVSSPAFDGVSADGREYGDAVEELDDSAGQVIDLLRGLDLEDQTLLIFLSNNGPAGGANTYQAGSTGGLRGSKGSTLEGGIRVPCIASWPGVIPAGLTLTALGADVDLAPTILEVTNVTVPPAVSFDGVSLFSTMTGGAPPATRPLFWGPGASLDAVRSEQWKLRNGALYDLAIDPSESTDLALQFPSVVASLQAELDAFEADVSANSRPPEARSTFIGNWAPNVGLQSSGFLVDGQEWTSTQHPSPSWRVVDADPSVAFEVVPRTGPGPGDQTPIVLRAETPSPSLRLERSGLPVEAMNGFSVGLWTRSLETLPSTELVLLDAGGPAEGLSITIGDGGELGDDPSPGRADDLRVRVRSGQTGQATTVTVDLPATWTTELTHVVVTYDVGGDLVVYVQAYEAGRAQATAGTIPSLPTTNWALFGRDGPIAASAGPGPAPFNATACFGELGKVLIQSRAMFRPEVERSHCRHVQYPFCSSTQNAAGNYAEMELMGRFHLEAEDLSVRVSKLPPGTFGFMIASRAQRRLPVASGYVCLANPIFRISRQVAQSDATGTATYVMDPLLAPPALNLQNSPFMNFQFWFRDGANSNFTNAVNVLFCP